MKVETLKSSKRKYFLCALIVGVVLLITLVLTTSMAKYQTVESIKIAEGTINYKPYDFKILAMYQEDESGTYQEIEVMPSSGYAINEEKSYCYLSTSSEKDTNAKLYTNSNGEHVIANLSKNDKCYLYFDIYNPMASDIILANKTVSTRDDFSTVLTADTTGTIYSAEDDDGTSYYFAGAATDNYVRFAGFFWRIIRINGDGTIRLIYAGTSAIANGTSSTDTQIGTSAFNGTKSDNMYVGFMYTSGSVHGLGTSSNIKGVLDSWYESDLASYEEFIDTDAGFCGDRGSNTSDTSAPNGTGGTGTTATYYAARYRLYYQIYSQNVAGASPTFKCADSSDFYTVSSSSKGNKALTNPIGLITADEAAFAGGVYNKSNSSYYLYTGQYYWTLSPSYFASGNVSAYLFSVSSGGVLTMFDSGYGWGVRPVINLKANTLFATGGEGTLNDPYVVQT